MDKSEPEPHEQPTNYTLWDVWDFEEILGRQRDPDWADKRILHPRVDMALSYMRDIYYVASLHPRLGGDPGDMPLDVVNEALQEGLQNIAGLLLALTGTDKPLVPFDLDRFERVHAFYRDVIVLTIPRLEDLIFPGNGEQTDARSGEESDDGEGTR